MITLSEYSWLQGFSFFLFSTLNMSCHSHQACKVSAEKAVDDLGRVPLYVTSSPLLTAFKVLSLALSFDMLIILCLGVGTPKI